LAHTIDQCLEESRLQKMSSNIINHKKQFTWDYFIEGMEYLYSQIA